jgi:hypothetical protein
MLLDAVEDYVGEKYPATADILSSAIGQSCCNDEVGYSVPVELARLISSRLKGRTLISQHGLADDLDGRKALLEKCVVKFLQAEATSHLLLVVLSELHDFQLAECINQVGGVAGASLRLDFGD